MEPVTGTIDFVLDGETFKTAYKIFGDLKAPCPLLVLHGGPGIPHQYLLTFSALASKTRPVIFYDQIGCGLSTHLPNKPAEFWTVEMFMKELDNVIAQLLADTVFDLAGHSWGGMLGADYIISRLRRLILADAPASMELWSVGANLLLDHKFPAEFGDMLRKYERDASAKSQTAGILSKQRVSSSRHPEDSSQDTQVPTEDEGKDAYIDVTVTMNQVYTGRGMEEPAGVTNAGNDTGWITREEGVVVAQDLRNEIVDVEFSVKTRTGDVRRVGKSLEGEEGTGRPGRVRRAARSVWSEEGELHYVGDEARARDVAGVRSSVRPPSGCRQRQSDRWGREAHERRLWQDERRVGRGKDGWWWEEKERDATWRNHAIRNMSHLGWSLVIAGHLVELQPTPSRHFTALDSSTHPQASGYKQDTRLAMRSRFMKDMHLVQFVFASFDEIPSSENSDRLGQLGDQMYLKHESFKDRLLSPSHPRHLAHDQDAGRCPAKTKDASSRQKTPKTNL
ncbi:Alpha/Beta hydrolase protein, partial [Roridomyces roridus]